MCRYYLKITFKQFLHFLFNILSVYGIEKRVYAKAEAEEDT